MSKEIKIKTSGTSIGFGGLLTLLFVGLKLGEVGVVANWSWWWVFAPIWLPLAFIGAFLVLCAILIAIFSKHG